MPNQPSENLLQKAISGDLDLRTALLGMLDRKEGRFECKECQLLDFKQQLDLTRQESIGELARDVLAFANTHGGILLIGVDDNGRVIGSEPLRSKPLRDSVGLYTGTRVEYEVLNPEVPVKEKQVRISAIVVRSSETSYPTLLRKDIEFAGKMQRKVKYLAGSLFFREHDQTRVEPVGGDIDSRAVELGFNGASPRTRSSFVLEQDTPGVRLYAHINDKFFGRVDETGDLVGKYDDARGRGISIGGQGGIGKTELGIEITKRLFQTSRFKSIYSGSAKTTLLGPTGSQETDPAFSDYPSFLKDLATWAGLDVPKIFDVQSLEAACIAELKRRGKTLIFADNLETVEDGRLFEFLERKIPENVWLLTTSRVHKIKNWIYALQLSALTARDAARLLRYELKKQGLQEHASLDINDLEKVTAKLFNHPLAIRWYAWICKRQPDMWSKGPENVPKDDLEAFCIGNTLSNIGHEAQKVVSAIASSQTQLDRVSAADIEKISGVSGMRLESALYELETAGLISTYIDDQDGQVNFAVVPLAISPAKDLARQHHWEMSFVAGLNILLDQRQFTPPDDPLLRDLVNFDVRALKQLNKHEIEDLKARVGRVLKRPHAFQIEILHLMAECERHLGNPISADENYMKAAELVLQSGDLQANVRYQVVLIDAATMAKTRSHAAPQLERAIRYLQAVETSHRFALRILATLAQLYAMLGNREQYEIYRTRARRFKDAHIGELPQNQIWDMEETLKQAEGYLAEGKNSNKSAG